jgi:uncharacterized protein YqgC (DUF456 family)
MSVKSELLVKKAGVALFVERAIAGASAGAVIGALGGLPGTIAGTLVGLVANLIISRLEAKSSSSDAIPSSSIDGQRRGR